MSGTAGLSAAKNRRSGNEVKIPGQNKQQLPPPLNTRVEHQHQNQQHQQQQQQPQFQQKMPHPMDILKSHEIRLRQIENGGLNESSEELSDEFLSFRSEFISFKAEFLASKNAPVQKGPNVSALQTRINDLCKTVAVLEGELSHIKSLLAQQNGLNANDDNIEENINLEIQEKK